MVVTDGELALFNLTVAGRQALSETAFFAAELAAWRGSPARLEALAGAAYYEGRHDILHRERQVIGEDGQLQTVHNLPNNRIVDNQYGMMLDQKTNYLLGQPVTVLCEASDDYAALLSGLLDSRFHRILKYIGEEALQGGIGWLHPYYEDGALRFRHFPAHQILPFWRDDDHTALDAALRLYAQEVYDGPEKRIVERVEIYKPDGLWRYVVENGSLIPDAFSGPHEPYIMQEGAPGWNWERIPLIPFKANKREIPLLRRVKSLQDAINLTMSDWENNMQEDGRASVMVITNYDGENLAHFRRNLAQFGAVLVQSDGGIDTLKVEVNAANYEAILGLYKKRLIENARGFDGKDERLSNNPNQMNIQAMLSDIDLDANGMETEFQAALTDLRWFLDQHLMHLGKGDFSGLPVTFVFNRDMPINEGEAIDNCVKSVGILSDETIVAQHPWTTDPKEELARLEAQRQKEAEAATSYDPFAPPMTGGDAHA